MLKERAIMNWSGGKDSALALYKLLNDDSMDIICLLTSISEMSKRVSMHGVRSELLDNQAYSIGLPLVKMELPEMPNKHTYENQLKKTLTELKTHGATASVYGDIFLEDLKSYREELLLSLNLRPVFPLWNKPSMEIMEEFLNLGFKAIVTCVNDLYLDQSFAGRILDENFLSSLPDNVDPCGENGEYHTFVFDGPLFNNAVSFELGQNVYKKFEGNSKKAPNPNLVDPSKSDPFEAGFWYVDLLPSQ